VSTFTPQTPAEARALDEHLREYARTLQAPLLAHLSLERVFTVASASPERGRICSYCVEIQIHVLFLQSDLANIARARETLGMAGEAFATRADLLRANSDFVLRYRALWDKLMGFIVLLTNPAEFQSFAEAKSRKKAFLGIVERKGNFPTPLAGRIGAVIDRFDGQFRTAEAHGSGSARKLASSDLDGWDSPQSDLFWAWNEMNTVLDLFGKLFSLPDPV